MYKHGMLLVLMSELLCLGVVDAAENQLARLLPGTWQGMSGEWRFIIKLQRNGKGNCRGSALQWRGFTESEAMRVARGARLKPPWRHAACTLWLVSAKVDGDKVDFQFAEPKPLVEGPAKPGGHTRRGRLIAPGIVVQRPPDKPQPGFVNQSCRL